MSRAIWLVLDSLGLGAALDAGADTFGHIAATCSAIHASGPAAAGRRPMFPQ